MKKTLSFRQVMAVTCLMLIFSCKKDAAVKSPNSPMNNKQLTDSNFVSISKAAVAAREIKNSHIVSAIIKQKTVYDINLTSIKEVLDSLAVPDNTNPSYYIFNYVGGGFSIISADKRVEPILAYSNNGYFPRSGSLPEGLANWLVVNHKNMQLVRRNPKLKIPAVIANLWAELGPEIKTGNQIINVAQQPPPPCQPTYSNTTVGPLLHTKWGQGQPYNLLCPAGAVNGHSPTGCVATAMAQVMYYWKYPSTYNWAIMPTAYNSNPITYPGNQDVAQLMLDAGRSVTMIYGSTESNPYDGFLNPPISCTTALKNTFHYSSSSESNYNYLTVVSNINAGEPVLLSASTDNHTFLFWNWGTNGHEWVCDGYQQIYETWCPSGDTPGGGEGFLYLHMNWGWDGTGNDLWQDFNQWIVFDGQTTDNWQYNQEMTYNIHP